MTTPNPYRQKISPFSHITSNLKTRIDTDLAPLTFVCGPNRSYKTSIRQSIRLAAQRTLTVQNKRTPLTAPSKLIKFAADPERGISISLQSASGNLTFRLPVNEETRKAKEAEPRGVTNDFASLTEEDWQNAFPMDTVRQMLFMDARQARQAIVRIFAQGFAVTPPLGLSDLQKEMWNLGLSEIAQSDDPVESLSALAAWAHEQKPKKTRAANSREDSLAPLKERALLSGQEVLPELEKKLADAKAWEATAADRSTRERLRDTWVEADNRLKALASQVKHLKQSSSEQERLMEEMLVIASEKHHQAHALVADLEGRIEYGTRLGNDLRTRIEADRDECPFNHTVPLEQLRKDLTRIETTLKKRRAEFEVATLDFANLERANDGAEIALAEHRRDSKRDIDAITMEMVRLEASKDANSKLITMIDERLKNAPASYQGQTAEDLEKRVRDLRGAASARQQYEDGMREVRRLHDESAACKVIEGQAHEIMQRVLKDSRETAENRINEFMPPAFRAELNLEGEGCEFRVVGSDGEYHDASASGSEFGSLIVALASALPGRLKILDLDDHDLHPFDPENIAGLWAAIEHAVESGALTQAIVVHNRPDEAPSRERGWLILKRVAVTNTTESIPEECRPQTVQAVKIAPFDGDLMKSI